MTRLELLDHELNRIKDIICVLSNNHDTGLYKYEDKYKSVQEQFLNMIHDEEKTEFPERFTDEALGKKEEKNEAPF